MSFIGIRALCKTLPLILVVAFCLQAVPAASKMYKWRDAEGKLHFSDSPDSVPAEILNDDSKEYKPDTSRLGISSSELNNSDKGKEDAAADDVETNDISIPYVAREGSASRVIINVTFNDSVTAPILVDTGSPGLIITDGLADRLGLFDKTGSSLMVLISGIGGNQAAARTIVNKVSLGGITEEFIPAHIVPEMSDSYDGLIGMDILSSYRLTIDPANRRLIANATDAAKDLPAGRDKLWWQTRYREFSYYYDFWEKQVSLIGKSDSPYGRMPSRKQERIKTLIIQQRDEAKVLLSKLERFARWNSVPRHWRR